ncbi:MAG: hypothetical protein LBH84_03385, partial [Prevotellaceae bacterium]|nr:hypothetical protein [Prevotellaceae bacterium]
MKKQKPPRHAKKMQPAQPQAGAAQRMSGSTASPRRAAKRMQPAQPQVDTAAELRRLRQNYRSISMSIAVLLASVAAYVVTAKVTLLFYHPNIEQTIELAQKTLVWGGKPEPVEAFLFRLGVLTIPLFMVGAFMLLTKTRLSSIEWERYFKPLSIGFVLLA